MIWHALGICNCYMYAFAHHSLCTTMCNVQMFVNPWLFCVVLLSEVVAGYEGLIFQGRPKGMWTNSIWNYTCAMHIHDVSFTATTTLQKSPPKCMAKHVSFTTFYNLLYNTKSKSKPSVFAHCKQSKTKAGKAWEQGANPKMLPVIWEFSVSLHAFAKWLTRCFTLKVPGRSSV